jgi:hypothetical protein
MAPAKLEQPLTSHCSALPPCSSLAQACFSRVPFFTALGSREIFFPRLQQAALLASSPWRLHLPACSLPPMADGLHSAAAMARHPPAVPLVGVLLGNSHGRASFLPCCSPACREHQGQRPLLQWRPCCRKSRPPLRCSTPTAPFSHGAAANLHSRPFVADQRPCPYLQPLLAVLRGACRLFDEMSSRCRRAPCLSPRGCSLDVVVEPSLLRLAPSMFLGRSIKCLTEQLVLSSPFAMSSTPVRHLAALAAIVFLCSVKKNC